MLISLSLSSLLLLFLMRPLPAPLSMSLDRTGVAAAIPDVLDERVEMMARRREKKSRSRCRTRSGEEDAVDILCSGPLVQLAPSSRGVTCYWVIWELGIRDWELGFGNFLQQRSGKGQE